MLWKAQIALHCCPASAAASASQKDLDRNESYMKSHRVSSCIQLSCVYCQVLNGVLGRHPAVPMTKFELQVEQHWSDDTSNEEDSSTSIPEASGQLQDERSRDSDNAAEQQHAPRHMQTSETSAVDYKEQTDKPDQEQQHPNYGSGKDELDAGAMDSQSPDDEVDEAYVMAYLGRHMCPQEAVSADEEGGVCGGAMTPVGVHGDTYVCNMCGYERSESERVAELAQTFHDVSEEVRQGNEPGQSVVS